MRRWAPMDRLASRTTRNRWRTGARRTFSRRSSVRTTTAVGPGSPGGCRPAAARRVAPRATSTGCPRGSRVVTQGPRGPPIAARSGRVPVPGLPDPGARDAGSLRGPRGSAFTGVRSSRPASPPDGGASGPRGGGAGGGRWAGPRGGALRADRRLWARAYSLTRSTSSTVTASRPSHAARAEEALRMTRSARSPSTPSLQQRVAISEATSPGTRTRGRTARAARRRARSRPSSGAHSARKPTGSTSKALTRAAPSPRPRASARSPQPTRTPPGPLARIRQVLGGHEQAEPVEELGPQLPLLGIHGAHQDEPARVADRHALALHDRHAARRHVQEEVHQVVREQVDLVHVEDPAVGPGQKTRLKPLLAPAESPLEVEGAHDPVFRGAQGERHEGGRSLLHLDLAAQLAGVQGIAPRRAVPVGGERRQEGRQGAGGAGLGRPAPPHDEHAADPGIDGGEEERELHALLPHDGGKGERDHSLTSTSASLRR